MSGVSAKFIHCSAVLSAEFCSFRKNSANPNISRKICSASRIKKKSGWGVWYDTFNSFRRRLKTHLSRQLSIPTSGQLQRLRFTYVTNGALLMFFLITHVALVVVAASCSVKYCVSRSEFGNRMCWRTPWSRLIYHSTLWCSDVSKTILARPRPRRQTSRSTTKGDSVIGHYHHATYPAGQYRHCDWHCVTRKFQQQTNSINRCHTCKYTWKMEW